MMITSNKKVEDKLDFTSVSKIIACRLSKEEDNNG